MGGIYYAYPERSYILDDKPAPKGYEVFYISHYGRHGSRWVTDDERYEWVIKFFQDKSNLTATGVSVKKRLDKIWKDAKGNGGKLTHVGVRQHRQISERMYNNFIRNMGDDVEINAMSSMVGRCVSSMNAFTDRLKELNPKLRIEKEASQDTHNKVVVNTNEQKLLEKEGIDQPLPNATRFVKSLFKRPETIKEQEKLMSEMYTIASDMQDVEIGVSLYDIFTDEELRNLYEYNNRKMVHNNADLAQTSGIPARCAIPLWNNIIDEATDVIKSGSKAVDLRFGHDTQLYRLMTLMQLPLSYHMDDILPMAANLQIIFYRNNNKNDILIKVLHNECVKSLPIETDVYPYYHFDDVVKYYTQRIERLEHHRQLCSINTMVGTAFSTAKTAGIYGKGSEEHGQTLPAVLVPNGQNFWTPQTQDSEQKCIAPYYYADTLLQGFRNSHWIVGGCTQDYGSFTIAALGGERRMDANSRATHFRHKDEISHPHYYSVSLPDENLKVEMTATSHGAIFRITPNKDEDIHIIIQPNSDEGIGTIKVDSVNRTIEGENPVHRIYQGWGEEAGFSGHLIVKYDDTPLSMGVEGGIAYVTFKGTAFQPIIIKAASSFTGIKGARLNMKEEISDKSFDQVSRELTDTWTDLLHRIDIESKDTALVNQFYGALYRTSFLPREISDVDFSYPKFADGKTIVKGNRKHYTDYSMWDTYRALHPLLNIIRPSISSDMMQSLVDMYEEGGWMPIFPCWNSYTAAMIGDHCSSVLADAYIKGIQNVDYNKAYEGLRKNAFESPATYTEYKDGMGRRALKSYLKYGYIPIEDSVKEAFHNNEQVSRTLEYAYDDYALAQLAKGLDFDKDYKILMQRSANYKNVFDPRNGWVNGRNIKKQFLPLSDIHKRVPFLTEGAICHYSWYVPHDVKGLQAIMPDFTQRLDSLFDGGYYWHGNEPCHQIAYLYNYAGHPEKTQERVRYILSTEYQDTPGGLSGNDDAGQMSAWYIFSSLGFYPVCPATDTYQIGSPVFEKVKINLEDGNTFTISARNASRENIHIKQILKNGTIYNNYFIKHSDIMEGETFDMTMGK